MRIQNSNTFTTFQVNHKPRNIQISNVVQDLNAKAAQKNSSFDIAEISLRAKQLKQAETDEKLLKQKDSPYNGCLTQVEWAKFSLVGQRNGVNFVKDILLDQKDQLEHIMGKISKFEGIANGQISDPAFSAKEAAEIAERYRESVKTDFSKEIDQTVKESNWWVAEDGKRSNGLASKVMENELEKISAQSLGLSGLSKDPEEVMKALNGAIKTLQNLSNTIEDRFYQASGEHMEASVESVRFKRNEFTNLNLPNIEASVVHKYRPQTLQIDADFLEKWSNVLDRKNQEATPRE